MSRHSHLLLTTFAVLSSVALVPAIASNQPSQSAPTAIASLPNNRIKELAIAYKVHSKKRNAIAVRLEECWKQEREITGERDRRGRDGDMASVISLERELLKIREEIDSLRQDLTRENRVLSLISQASNEQF